MKKIFLMTMLGLTVQNAFAVNSATGPNSVYIQQLGSSNNIVIEQEFFKIRKLIWR